MDGRLFLRRILVLPYSAPPASCSEISGHVVPTAARVVELGGCRSVLVVQSCRRVPVLSAVAGRIMGRVDGLISVDGSNNPLRCSVRTTCAALKPSSSVPLVARRRGKRFEGGCPGVLEVAPVAQSAVPR